MDDQYHCRFIYFSASRTPEATGPAMTDLVPTDRELEALKVLWQRGEATVRDVWRAMTAAENDLAYTTVLSLLQVMEQKGLVGHKRVGKAYAYFAKVRREPTVRKLAGGFPHKVSDGA